MSDTESNTPKVFISYAWSSKTHQEWVLRLATDLRENGVDAILDVWDLKEGHDAHAFMESMVSDPSIQKVIIVSDENYSMKADKREGGVGIESQIITPEIYGKKRQEKYVVVVREYDAEDRPCLPNYAKSRIYIDMVSDDSYAESFEKLCRWIFGKPLNNKPNIGRAPEHVSSTSSKLPDTGTAFRVAQSSIRLGSTEASGPLKNALEKFSLALEELRITEDDNEHDDKIVESINRSIHLRNEFLQFAILSSRHPNFDMFLDDFRAYFEDIQEYCCRPERVTRWTDLDFDNFKFVVHEQFLYFCSVLLNERKFDALNAFLGEKFFCRITPHGERSTMQDYNIFRNSVRSLDHRNQRLKLRRLSLHADMLEQRNAGSGISFERLMEADFILFLRSAGQTDSEWNWWWPVTLIYSGRVHGGFELFTRAGGSDRWKKNLVEVLGLKDMTAFCALVAKFRARSYRSPSWEFTSVNVFELSNAGELC